MQDTNPWQTYIDYLLRAKLDWEEYVPCKEVGPQEMYPASESKQLKVAQRICSMCPAQAECLTIAIAMDEPFGVWGGTSEKQRAEMKKKLTAISTGYDKAHAINDIVLGFLKGQDSEETQAPAQMEA